MVGESRYTVVFELRPGAFFWYESEDGEMPLSIGVAHDTCVQQGWYRETSSLFTGSEVFFCIQKIHLLDLSTSLSIKE